MSLLNNKKRISIRSKIFVLVGLFVLLNIIINILIVRLSINDIYIGLEKRNLKKEYQTIKNNLYNKRELINSIYEASNNGMKVKIYDSNLNVIYTIFSDEMNEDFTKFDLMLLDSIKEGESEIITLKNYNQSGYDLHLVGKIDNNYTIISSSVESLKKDAKTTVIVIVITSLFTFGILTIIAYFISKIFSNKINEIKQVTKNISDLKFDKEISVKTNDELGDLLKNINEMSRKLQKSINELECANKKLKQDLVEKERQEIARKKLIANISHEFKTPLTIISGYSQLLLESVDSEDKENVELIINESDRLSELVHEFLELSKLESGKVKLNKENIDMKNLIETELKKLNVRIKDRKIKLKKEFDGNQVINGDIKQITKVIENILTNAIKFTKDKKIIEIKSYSSGDYYFYEVFNTGDQIKEEDLNNIFNSYYKDKSSRNKEGTGLGLTIVKAIVDLHGGNCFCKNEDDGVRFIIKIKVQ